MELYHVLIGWSAVVICLELIMWHIFYKKTVRICFITEPDLPLSRYFTIGMMRVVIMCHTALLIAVIVFFYNFLW